MGLFDRLFGQEPEKLDPVQENEAVEEKEEIAHEPSVMEVYQAQMLERIEEIKRQEAEKNLTAVESDQAPKAEESGLGSDLTDVKENFLSEDQVAAPEIKEDQPFEEDEIETSVQVLQGSDSDRDQEPAQETDPAESTLEEHQVSTPDLEESASSEQVLEEDLPAQEQDLALETEDKEEVQDKYDRTLKKTRTGFGARLNAFFANFRTVDEEFFEELEEMLILSDVGVQVASQLTEKLREEAKLENAKKTEALRRLVIENLVDLYEKDGIYNEAISYQDGLTVMLFVGVNGVGKTTSIGKLAYQLKNEGKKVMLVAADTFRAGAVAQLEEWSKRVGVDLVKGPENSDPASVVFDGMERALAEGVDVLMIDTAGRLQNKDNLMAELEKIGRIIKRVLPEAPHETFLALDASTGQNALVQAKEFSKITPVTGIVLTKLDGTAKGGVVLAIREELDIPVKLIGFGEKIDDIGPFQSENFMRGLLEGLI